MKSTFFDYTPMLNETLETEKKFFLSRKKKNKSSESVPRPYVGRSVFLYVDMGYSEEEIEAKLYASGAYIPAEMIKNTVIATVIKKLTKSAVSPLHSGRGYKACFSPQTMIYSILETRAVVFGASST